MIEFSQPSVSIRDKRALRHALLLIGEVVDHQWANLGVDQQALPTYTLRRFPDVGKPYLDLAEMSVGITEPSDTQKGRWTLAFDRYAPVDHPHYPFIGWRIGYALMEVDEPDELSLRVDSFGAFSQLSAIDPVSGRSALDSPTAPRVFLPEDYSHPPLEAAEVRVLYGEFAVQALAQLQEALW